MTKLPQNFPESYIVTYNTNNFRSFKLFYRVSVCSRKIAVATNVIVVFSRIAKGEIGFLAELVHSLNFSKLFTFY